MLNMQIFDSERLNLNLYDVLTYINTTYIYISLKSKHVVHFDTILEICLGSTYAHTNRNTKPFHQYLSFLLFTFLLFPFYCSILCFLICSYVWLNLNS